jgi:hypothetical protein
MIDESATHSRVARNCGISIIDDFSNIGESTLGLSKAAVTSSNTVINLINIKLLILMLFHKWQLLS